VMCRAILGFVFAPLMFGALVGVMVSDHVLAAVERAQREQREKRVTRVTSYTDAANAEARWFILDTAVNGPVLEWVYDGGATINVRN